MARIVRYSPLMLHRRHRSVVTACLITLAAGACGVTPRHYTITEFHSTYDRAGPVGHGTKIAITGIDLVGEPGPRNQLWLRPQSSRRHVRQALEDVLMLSGYELVDGDAEDVVTVEVVVKSLGSSDLRTESWAKAQVGLVFYRDGQFLTSKYYRSKRRAQTAKGAFTGAVNRCIDVFHRDVQGSRMHLAITGRLPHPRLRPVAHQ